VGGVYAGDGLLVPRRGIAGGYVQPHADGPPSLHLLDGNGRSLLEARAANEAQGTAFIQALRLDSAETAVLFPLPLPVPAPWLWLLVALIVLLPLFADREGQLLGLASASGVAVLANRFGRKIVVGTDGLFLWQFGLSRFIPYARIVGVERTEKGVGVQLRTGKTLVLPTRHNMRGGIDQAEVMSQRIHDAMDRYARGGAGRETAARLARGGRSIDAWVRDLRAMGEAGDAYRAASVPAEELWRVVEDPSVPAAARAGAAVALQSSLDGAARERLAAASSVTASPKVRVAIESAAATDEAALARALADLDDDPSRKAGG
jgi:hypothetical protein